MYFVYKDEVIKVKIERIIAEKKEQVVITYKEIHELDFENWRRLRY